MIMAMKMKKMTKNEEQINERFILEANLNEEYPSLLANNHFKYNLLCSYYYYYEVYF